MRDRKGHNYIIALAFVLMLAVGIFTIGDYGQPLDEQWEYSLMLANIKEYVVHLPDSGLKDKLSDLNIIRDIIPISQTGEADHGEAAYHPYTVAVIVLGRLFAVNSSWLLHAYTFLIFMLGVVSMYFIVKRIFGGRFKALFASLLLYLTPRMFADAHYNNKDIVLMSLALFTVWMGLEMIGREKFRYAVLFALGGAFATNTKIAGAWFFGVLGLVYLGKYILGLVRLHRLAVGLVAIVVFFACYWIITPGMWDDPVGFLQYLIANANDFSRWDSYILFNGQFYKDGVNALPRIYLPWMIAVTTPVFILVGVVAGLARNIADICGALRRESIASHRESGALDRESVVRHRESGLLAKGGFMLLMALLWLFPLVYAVVTGTRVYNGWRHFYFVYGPMVVTATYGLEWLGDIVGNRVARRSLVDGRVVRRILMDDRVVRRGIAGALLVSLAVGLLCNRSAQQAYYNILAGTCVSSRYELDYWDVSVLDVLNEIKNIDQADEIYVGSTDSWTLAGLKKTLRMIDDDRLECVDWQYADWIILNPGYVRVSGQEGLDAQSFYVMDNYDKVYEKKSYGNVVMKVYRKQ